MRATQVTPNEALKDIPVKARMKMLTRTRVRKINEAIRIDGWEEVLSVMTDSKEGSKFGTLFSKGIYNTSTHQSFYFNYLTMESIEKALNLN